MPSAGTNDKQIAVARLGGFTLSRLNQDAKSRQTAAVAESTLRARKTTDLPAVRAR